MSEAHTPMPTSTNLPTDKPPLRIGGVHFELGKISLTGFLALLMALIAMVSGWYRFDARQSQDEIAIKWLQDAHEKDEQSRDQLRQAITELNITLGKVEQRLDDSDKSHSWANVPRSR